MIIVWIMEEDIRIFKCEQVECLNQLCLVMIIRVLARLLTDLLLVLFCCLKRFYLTGFK